MFIEIVLYGVLWYLEIGRRKLSLYTKLVAYEKNIYSTSIEEIKKKIIQ